MAEERRYQNLYRAAESEFLIEAGYEIYRYRGTGGKDGREDYEQNTTLETIQAQYGVLKDLAVGVELNNQRGGGFGEGYQDYEFFARGQYQSYFYEFRYFYSHEDQTGDEAVSGGDHYMVELGYVYGDFGAKLNITPTFSYDYANDDSDRENHTDYLIEGFYEKKMGDQLFGAKVSHLAIGKNVEDGSTISY